MPIPLESLPGGCSDPAGCASSDHGIDSLGAVLNRGSGGLELEAWQDRQPPQLAARSWARALPGTGWAWPWFDRVGRSRQIGPPRVIVEVSPSPGPACFAPGLFFGVGPDPPAFAPPGSVPPSPSANAGQDTILGLAFTPDPALPGAVAAIQRLTT